MIARGISADISSNVWRSRPVVDCRGSGGMVWMERDLEITYPIGRRKGIQINKRVVVARAVGSSRD